MTREKLLLQRLRARLAEWDRIDAEQLMRAGGLSSAALAAELNRRATEASSERKAFFLSDAVRRLLADCADDDEAITRVAEIVEGLRPIPSRLDLLARFDLRDGVARDREAKESKRRALEHVDALKGHLSFKYHERLDALAKDLMRDDLPTWRGGIWITGLEAGLVGHRGRAATTDNIGRWRAYLARRLDKLIPSEFEPRYAVIAELLSIAGLPTSRQNARGLPRKRRRR